MAYDDKKVYCSVQLDRNGELLAVLDASGKPVKHVPTGDGRNERPAKVGQKAPNGRVVKKVICIEIVTLEPEGGSGDPKGGDGHLDDPCYVHDRWCNWWCICPGIC